MNNNKLNIKAFVNGGIGCYGVLTIVFVVLKLLKVIDWSWWWVLSPIWISCSITIIILGIILIVFAVKNTYESKHKNDWRL